jgi:ppGpp synthetase/RelA/SpoT-type nucleotidyltranferase
VREEYESNVTRFEAFCVELFKQINQLLDDARIHLASPIEWRVKTWPSITDKISRDQSQPKALSEIGDVAGLRLIALFRRDLEPIQKIIESNFVILGKEDTFNRLSENQFGYGSIHYDVQPREEWKMIPTFRKFSDLRAEIQVRTASQHIWAAASHSLQYKKEAHVPAPLRRTINRVAALLETVDLEFERVLAERAEYANEIKKESEELPLDVETLKRVLHTTLPQGNRDPDHEPYADLLDELEHFGIVNTEQLSRLIKKHLEAALADENASLRRVREEVAKGNPLSGTRANRLASGVYFMHVGLARRVLSHEFGNEFEEYQTAKASSRFSDPRDQGTGGPDS